MVGSPINIALSGINAAATKIAVSAKNIANAQSIAQYQNGQTVFQPYTPQKVVQTAIENGGVIATVQDSTAEPVPSYEPTNPAANSEGFVDYPNVSLEQELISQKLAAYEFTANLNTIKIAKRMQDNILDIFG